MTEEKQSLEEWLAEERRRLKDGFSFEPEPAPHVEPSPATDILAKLGLGAGALAGVVADHANPVTFEGCSASTIADALGSEFTGQDTEVAINKTEEATTVTILQSQESHQRFSPALTVTLVEIGETLTVAMSDLSQDAKRGAIGSLGRTAVRQGGEFLLRRRGVVGMLDTAGDLIESVEDVAEDIQDLSLPKRVWRTIDRVGRAAEDAYKEEQGKRRALERKREATERAWTHCEWCGRAYAPDENDIVQCPSCGAPRGPRPSWLT
jgi:rubrerythrin